MKREEVDIMAAAIHDAYVRWSNNMRDERPLALVCAKAALAAFKESQVKSLKPRLPIRRRSRTMNGTGSRVNEIQQQKRN